MSEIETRQRIKPLAYDANTDRLQPANESQDARKDEEHSQDETSSQQERGN